MDRPRVVVTGIAGVTPLGLDMTTTWQRLIAGESGIGPITLFDTTQYGVHIAGEVKDFDAGNFGIGFKEAKHMDRFSQFAVASAKMLMDDSGYKLDPENPDNLGVVLGIGIGGLRTIELNDEKLLKSGPRKVSPFMTPMFIANMGSGQIAIATGAMGPNLICTTACASGTDAIGAAYTEITRGHMRACICGGVEAAVTPLGVAGFVALKALCASHNDDPTHASRPFDRTRDGFVVGEGCGLLMLELLDDALARGAKIYAEIVGYGASCDAYHMTAPKPDGSGMALAMKHSLRDAGIEPSAVGHINSHGTSTKYNDLTETIAMKQVFGEHAYKLHISATKSMTGHLLGAAGGIESCFAVKALESGILPGTINLNEPDPECDLDYTSKGSIECQCEYAMSNNFGFGGANASVIYKRWNG